MQVGFPWMFHCHAGLAGSIRVSSGAKVRVFARSVDGYWRLLKPQAERNHQSVPIPIGKPPVGLQAPSKTSCQLRANDFSPPKKARTVKSYIRRWWQERERERERECVCDEWWWITVPFIWDIMRSQMRYIGYPVSHPISYHIPI